MYTVVVPFYNRSKYSDRLLKSVAGQSISPSTVFIVDNGSSSQEARSVDNIISSSEISTLCVFLSTTKRGNANYARNLGYELSNTEFVAFLDSDDWWEPQHIEHSIKRIQESGKAGCYSGALIQHVSGTSIVRSMNIDAIGSPFDFLVSRSDALAQSSSFVISKKEVGDKVTWDERLKRSQDHDYFLSIQLKTRGWAFKPEPEYTIDWEDGGTKGSIDSASIAFFLEKWQPFFSKKQELLFFLRYISIFDAREMLGEIESIKPKGKGSIISRVLTFCPVYKVLAALLRIKSKAKSLLLR